MIPVNYWRVTIIVVEFMVFIILLLIMADLI
ncbi:hypothetical protein LCGC14_0396490 [marine sediment metagenome]|uniref:Uncharacterized protein n=1 Tax=marine sediment metagenome TaxID=412755 RepID=A0A0F9TG52_9ZZZZ